MMAMNPFLRDNRERVKEFLLFASHEVYEVHSDTSNNVIRERYSVCETPLSNTLSKKPNFSSMPSLVSRPAKLDHNDLSETEKLYLQLGKTLPTIEIGLKEKLSTLPSQVSELIQEDFNELKKLIENSDYSDPDTRKKNGNVLDKMKKMFGFVFC